MPLATCDRCKKMFTKMSDLVICPQCLPQEEEDYERLRDILQESPQLTAEQLSEKTDIELSCVLRCIASGRIQSMDQGERVRCGRCGAPAISSSKKLCESCLNQLSQEVAKAQSKIRLPKKREVELGRALNVSEEQPIRVSRSLDYRKRSGM